jgi:putative protein-disulfide isomerase|tara:strand:+ start:2184 stop:2762 length:579 start_codon:yes stop_codon:yes gene_type:complete
MCSWCWGFKPTWNIVTKQLKGKIQIISLLGGLAPDSDEDMPLQIRDYVQSNWRRIEEKIPGTKFNYDFWTKCKPRRSTYPACRAVISARIQSPEFEMPMISAIQKCYYLDAQNPSDEHVLVTLAEELGLDANKFLLDLRSEKVSKMLLAEISLAKTKGMSRMPSLSLQNGGELKAITIDFLDPDYIIAQIIS